MTVHPTPDSDRGRLPNTTERYSALPDKTRKLFEGMQDEDVENFASLAKLLREKGGSASVRRCIDMADRFNAAGRVTRWAITSLVAIVVGTASLVTAIKGITEWLHLGGPR